MEKGIRAIKTPKYKLQAMEKVAEELWKLTTPMFNNILSRMEFLNAHVKVSGEVITVSLSRGGIYYHFGEYTLFVTSTYQHGKIKNPINADKEVIESVRKYLDLIKKSAFVDLTEGVSLFDYSLAYKTVRVVGTKGSKTHFKVLT